MNILFLSLSDLKNLDSRGIYPDLLNCFAERGHQVYIVSPFQRRTGAKPCVIRVNDRVTILRVKIGNTTKTNLIEKGISTLTLEHLVKRAIRKQFSGIRFDLVLYPTPPITFCGAVSYIKKRDAAATYLMLKDIFPQNSLDLQMLSRSGIKGLAYRMFRRKEQKLYEISDHIGCMSPGNLRYLLEHETDIPREKIGLCPNAIKIHDEMLSSEETATLRRKYGLPTDRKILLYGGNVGKPQGVDFILRCLKQLKERQDVCVLVVGSGTEYPRLERYRSEQQQENLILMKEIGPAEFDHLTACCDIGLVFLDHRFTIPNFPSRILSYLQAGIPLLTATDPVTDLRQIVTENGFGLCCDSIDEKAFVATMDQLLSSDLSAMGRKGRAFLEQEYDVEKVCDQILQTLQSGVRV